MLSQICLHRPETKLTTSFTVIFRFQTVTVRWFHVCSVFCPVSTDDEARDLANQNRIRSFNWITPQHLDAAINPDSDKVQQLIEDAQQGNVPTSPGPGCSNAPD